MSKDKPQSRARADLGKLLLKRKLISEEQLREARQLALLAGFRTETWLAAMEAIDAPLLAKILHWQYGKQVVRPKMLKELTPGVLNLLPRNFINKHQVLPIREETRGLHLAMVDPTNAGVARWVSKQTKMKLALWTLPEWWFLQALEKHFGQPNRVKMLVEESRKEEPEENVEGMIGLDDGEELTSEDDFYSMFEADRYTHGTAGETKPPAAQTPAPSPPPAATSAPGAPPPTPPAEELVEEEPAPEAVSAEPAEGEVHDAEPIAEEEPSIEPLSAEEASERLATLTDRDEVARALLGYCVKRFKRGVLLILKGDLALGWDAAGGGLDKSRAELIMLPMSGHSVFETVVRSEAPFLGPPPSSPVDTRFFKALGGPPGSNILVMPISVMGRIRNILYCDNGTEEITGEQMTDLILMCSKVPAAYNRIVAARRKAS